jgi:hypothetical protein
MQAVGVIDERDNPSPCHLHYVHLNELIPSYVGERRQMSTTTSDMPFLKSVARLSMCAAARPSSTSVLLSLWAWY